MHMKMCEKSMCVFAFIKDKYIKRTRQPNKHRLFKFSSGTLENVEYSDV